MREMGYAENWIAWGGGEEKKKKEKRKKYILAVHCCCHNFHKIQDLTVLCRIAGMVQQTQGEILFLTLACRLSKCLLKDMH